MLGRKAARGGGLLGFLVDVRGNVGVRRLESRGVGKSNRWVVFEGRDREVKIKAREGGKKGDEALWLNTYDAININCDRIV